MRQRIKHWLEDLLALRRKNLLRGGETRFYASIDLSFLDDFDIKEFERSLEVDELVVDLMNYIKNVDYCDEVLRKDYRES